MFPKKIDLMHNCSASHLAISYYKKSTFKFYYEFRQDILKLEKLAAGLNAADLLNETRLSTYQCKY